MESVAKLRERIKQVLEGQITGYLMEELEETVIQSSDLNRFVVIRTGWYKGINHYALIQDVEIRKDKTVIIRADNTSSDLAAELIEAGIPAHKVVFASSLIADTQVIHKDSEPQQQRMAA